MTKITWTPSEDRDEKGDCESVGVSDDRTYTIARSGDTWTATVKQGRKSVVLAEGVKTGRAAWSKCVAHNKSAQTPAQEQPAA